MIYAPRPRRFPYVAGRWPRPVQVGRQRMIDWALRLAAGQARCICWPRGADQPEPFRREARGHPADPGPGALNLCAPRGRCTPSLMRRGAPPRARSRASPDVVIIDICGSIRLPSACGGSLKVRLVLDMDDLPSARYRACAKNRKQGRHQRHVREETAGADARAGAVRLPRVLAAVERPIARLERRRRACSTPSCCVAHRAAALRPATNGGTRVLGRSADLRSRGHSPRAIVRRRPALRLHRQRQHAPTAEALGGSRSRWRPC